MSKPFIAIRISARPTKAGKSRTGWVVNRVTDEGARREGFVWQHKPGPEELYRHYPKDSITVVGGFDVTVSEYDKVVTEQGTFGCPV